MADNNKTSKKKGRGVTTWTVENEDVLAGNLERYPCLYNVKDSTYKDRDKRSKARQELAELTSTTADAITTKIKNLRTIFGKEKAKEAKPTKSRSGVSGVKYTSKWRHFRALSFLSEFIIPKKTLSNLKVADACHDASDENEGEDNDDDDDTAIATAREVDVLKDDQSVTDGEDAMPRSTKCPTTKSKKRKSIKRKMAETVEMMMESAYSFLENAKVRKSAEVDDSDRQFGLYIASELRSVKDENLKIHLKFKLQSVLYEVKMAGTCMRPTPTHPSEQIGFSSPS